MTFPRNLCAPTTRGTLVGNVARPGRVTAVLVAGVPSSRAIYKYIYYIYIYTTGNNDDDALFQKERHTNTHTCACPLARADTPSAVGTRRIALSVYTLNTAEEQQLLQGDWSRSRKKSNMAENNSSRILWIPCVEVQKKKKKRDSSFLYIYIMYIVAVFSLSLLFLQSLKFLFLFNFFVSRESS